MAKPNPALLDPARYPFHCMIATRFGDLDVNWHINNVALVGIIEDGRVRFHEASGFHGAAAAMTALVASFSIEYLSQAWYPQPLAMHAAVARVGRSSFMLQQLLEQEGRIVSFAETVMVCMVDDQPAALPATFITDVSSWMLRP